MKERLLFVAAGPAQTPAIRDARAAGYHVIAMDGLATAPGLSEADEGYVADIRNAAEIVRIYLASRAQAIVSVCCDAAMAAVAEACEDLRLPGVPTAVVHISRSKLLQREAFRDAGLLTPDFRAVTEFEAALSAWDEFRAEACVFKPVDASGSRGVSYVHRRAEVAIAFDLARRNSASGGVIVESFMPGIEYSVEAWVVGSQVHVLATSEKVRTSPPFLLDRQVHFPDSLSAERRSVMVKHAVRAIEACGLRDCPVHLECIDHARGPMIVELAARGAGFKVFTEILPRVTGVSTTRASIEAALGQVPDLASRTDRSAASLVFIDPVVGVFRAAHGLEAARALPGVAEVVLYTHPGQEMNLLRSGSDRVGHILVYEQDASTCRATSHQALDLIRLEVEP